MNIQKRSKPQALMIAWSNYLTQPVVCSLAKMRVAPNTITWLGFLLAVGAAGLVISQNLFAAGWVVLLAGFCDMLDGALARYLNQASRFGAILDSTLDRLAEAILLLALLILYTGEASTAKVLLVALALVGSLLVSYIRARAEGAGLECQVGFFTRAERVIVLALGLLLSGIDYVLIIALALIMVFSFITASQRLYHVWRQTKSS